MKKILLLFLLLFVSGCSVEMYREMNILELEYPSSFEIIRRNDWSWQPLEYIIEEHKINKITIHHGGVDFDENRDVKDYLRGLQKWSRTDKEWIDIPYHFMIDMEGNIYEARPINYPGDTNTDYDPRGHALINVIGNYENQELSQNQLVAVIKMCVYLSQRFNVDPEMIKGHKDYTGQTVCPGKNLYKYLEDGSIVTKTKELISK